MRDRLANKKGNKSSVARIASSYWEEGSYMYHVILKK